MSTLAAILAGWVLDCLLGDPAGRWHPVCLMGNAISFLEKQLRRRVPDRPAPLLAAGGLLAALLLLLTGGLTAALLWLARRVSPLLHFAVSALLAWQILAARCLRDEAMKVHRALQSGDIEAARRQVSMLVGRDTESLDAAGITRAAVETVAENASDGVIAPLFWMMLAGPTGGMLYKAINTMDSMLGYKNDRYLWFGRLPARLDDVANWLPARLTALLMILAAPLCGLDGRGALRIWRRDRANHASPNSAHSEAACAGALGVRLAGPASYFGVVKDKPWIGDPVREIETEDIPRACRLMTTASLLALALLALLRLLMLSL
ncbi:MAG: cobalamin biosynthesis protein CobD [Clostridia bacterium]|nr:cobalamin biosynthesis protein CobD [Clostridia bacterium]